MATSGARGDFFIWGCSLRGWGYTGEEIFEKKINKKGRGGIVGARCVTALAQGVPHRWRVSLSRADCSGSDKMTKNSVSLLVLRKSLTFTYKEEGHMG